MNKKRIMVLGGNVVQAEATLTAKQSGYYTISTDLHKDNPGHAIADEYCPVDIIDKEAVLREARRLHIDGIIPYTSDVLAPVAAYVSDAMHLPCSPYSAVEIMTHKDLFREFLHSHGYNVPQGRSFTDKEEALAFFRSLGGTAMMKPVDNAGSKGVFKVNSEEEICQHWQESMDYSLSKRIIIEQFIERTGMQQDGDIFVSDGKIVFWSLGDQHKDPIAPFVPAVYTFPNTMPEEYEEKAKQTVQELITALGFTQGPCNIEYIVSTKGEIYILEIGPRNGGNLIPFGIQEVTGVDLTAMTVQAALGETVTVPEWKYSGYSATVMLHSQEDGILKGFNVPEEYRHRMKRSYTFRHEGDAVKRFHNTGDTIASMAFRFDTREELEQFTRIAIKGMVTLQ